MIKGLAIAEVSLSDLQSTYEQINKMHIAIMLGSCFQKVIIQNFSIPVSPIFGGPKKKKNQHNSIILIIMILNIHLP